MAGELEVVNILEFGPDERQGSLCLASLDPNYASEEPHVLVTVGGADQYRISLIRPEFLSYGQVLNQEMLHLLRAFVSQYWIQIIALWNCEISQKVLVIPTESCKPDYNQLCIIKIGE